MAHPMMKLAITVFQSSVFVFQSSAKFNKSTSVITRNKTEQKKFAKKQIREKGIRYDQKKKKIFDL